MNFYLKLTFFYYFKCYFFEGYSYLSRCYITGVYFVYWLGHWRKRKQNVPSNKIQRCVLLCRRNHHLICQVLTSQLQRTSQSSIKASRTLLGCESLHDQNGQSTQDLMVVLQKGGTFSLFFCFFFLMSTQTWLSAKNNKIKMLEEEIHLFFKYIKYHALNAGVNKTVLGV